MLTPRLALFDQVAVFKNPAGIEKKRNLMSVSDSFDGLEILQRDRMPAAGVDAQLDVDPRGFLTVLVENGLEFREVDAALEQLPRREIVSVIADDVDNFAAVGLDMKSRGGEEHVARHHAAFFHMHLCPDSLRRPALCHWHHVGETKDRVKVLRQRNESPAAFRGHLHPRLQGARADELRELSGAE